MAGKKRFTEEELREHRRLASKGRTYTDEQKERNKQRRKERGISEEQKEKNRIQSRIRDKSEEGKLKAKLRHERNKEHNNQRARNHSKTIDGKYSEYKGTAKKRELDFNLSKEEFAQFWKQDCSYCGSHIETIGLDRIDSSKGYEIGNIVSCCTICNKAKLDHSTVDFLSHIEKILDFTKNPFTINNCHITKPKHRHPSKYNRYKNNAKFKNKEFTLTKDEFLEITTTNCAYCGHDIDLGVDRIDSSKGYIEGNCISCCATCNDTKWAMSMSDFYLHLIKISEYQLTKEV